jgi:hypothetical protein
MLKLLRQAVQDLVRHGRRLCKADRPASKLFPISLQRLCSLLGAGGGQLLDPSGKPKKLIAIEHDREALGK